MRSLIGGVVSAAFATTMLAAPAHAEYYSIDDPADAESSRTDVYGMRTRHGADQVNVAMAFDDLRRSSRAGVSVYFDTVKSRRGPEFLLNSGLGDGTDYALTRAWRWKSRGEHVDCDYMARVKWGVDRFRTLLDRDCFGDPDEIRVSVRMADDVDGSPPVVDWVPGRHTWSLWLGPGV